MKQSDTKQDLLKMMVLVRDIVVGLKRKNQYLNKIVNSDKSLQAAADEIEQLHTKITSMESELSSLRKLRVSQNRLHYSQDKYKRYAMDGDSMDEAGTDYTSDRGNDSGTDSGIYSTFRRGVKYVHDNAGFLLNSDSPAKSRNDSSSPLVPGAFKVNLSDATDSSSDIIGMDFTQLKTYLAKNFPSAPNPTSYQQAFSSVLNNLSEDEKQKYKTKYKIIGDTIAGLKKIQANCRTLHTLNQGEYTDVQQRANSDGIMLPPLVSVPDTAQKSIPDVESLRDVLSHISSRKRNVLMTLVLQKKATAQGDLQKILKQFCITNGQSITGAVQNSYYLLFEEDETSHV